jgi:hypothetical protein
MNEIALNKVEITYDLPQIKYDLTELNTQVDGLIEQYKGYIILDESELPSAKKVLANLNATTKEISDMRIAIVKKIKEPLDKFEIDIKTITKKVETLSGDIKTQVSDYDTRIKERKRTEIKALPDYADYTVFNETWLNKTVPLSQVEFELAEQKKTFQAACNVIQTTCTICELDTAKYFDLLSKGTELNSIIELIKNDRAVKQQYANVSSAPSVSPKEIIIDTDSDIYTRTYKIKGTKQQLKMVYDYMQTVGVIILEKS